MANFNINSYIPPVTRHLLIINVVIWLLMAIFPEVNAALYKYGAIYYFTNDLINPAQLFTYMFIHADFMHLFFNMFALFMFGRLIENALGSNRFLFYYIACGVGAALIQEGVFAISIAYYTNQLTDQLNTLAVYSAVPPGLLNELLEATTHGGYSKALPASKAIAELIGTPAVGASGAIYGILLAVAVLFPTMPIYIWFIPIPVKAKWFVIGYAVIELFEAVSPRMGDNVAHWAHLGGMIVGFLIILYWRRKNKLYGGLYH